MRVPSSYTNKPNPEDSTPSKQVCYFASNSQIQVISYESKTSKTCVSPKLQCWDTKLLLAHINNFSI